MTANPKEITREEMVEAMARVIDPAAYVGLTKFLSYCQHAQITGWHRFGLFLGSNAGVRMNDALNKARDCLSILNPLLERVAGVVAIIGSEHAAVSSWIDTLPIPTDGATYRLGKSQDAFRQAASLHSELKGLING